MLTTKRKPVTVGEILGEEFMEPFGLTQGALAKAMGVQRKHVNELCNDRRTVTAPTALILARVFGNSPEFWLNVQRRSDIWDAMHTPRERKRIGAPALSERLHDADAPRVASRLGHVKVDQRGKRRLQAAIACSGVQWRARRDSNLRPQRSEAFGSMRQFADLGTRNLTWRCARA